MVADTDSTKADHPAQTCLLVLGMHRSGTSALTRVLNLMGAVLPDSPMGAGEGNVTGHWESVRLYEYNERLLSELGTSWSDWRPLDFTRLPLSQRRDIQTDFREIVESEVHDAPLFVIKEPRLCRFAGFFMKALEDGGTRVAPVLIIRNPLEVVDSLRTRASGWPEGYTEADATLAWLMHVLEAEKASRKHRRAIVSYDALMSDWSSVREAIEEQAGIVFSKKSEDVAPLIKEFLSSDLRHHARSSSEVALDPRLRGWVSETYEAMITLIANPGSRSAQKSLDRIYADTRRVMPILQSLMSASRQDADNIRQAYVSANKELASRDEELRQARERLDELDQKLTTEVSERDYFSGRSEALEKLVVEGQAEVESLRKSNEIADAKLLDQSAAMDLMVQESKLVAENNARVAEELSAAKIQAAEAEALAKDRANEIEKLTRQASELEAGHFRLMGDLSGAQARIAEVEQIASESAIEVENLREKTAELEVYKLEALQAADQVASQQSEIDSLRSEMQRVTEELESQLAAEATARRELETEVNDKRVAADDLQAELEAFKKEKQEAADQVASQQSEIDSLRSEMQRVTEELESQLATEATARRELETEVNDKRAAVDDLQAELLKTRKKIEAEERAKSDLHTKLKRNILLLEDAETRTQQFEEEFKTARILLGVEASDNRDLPQIIEVRNQEKEDLERNFEAQESALKDVEIRARNFELEISKKASALVDRVNAADELMQRVDSLRSRLAAGEQSFERAQAELRQLQMREAEKEAAVARLAAELDKTHESYRNSTSWRITWPLRIVKRLPVSVVRALRLTPGAVKVGGGLVPSAGKTIRIVRQEGLGGIRKRLAYVENSSSLDAMRGTGAATDVTAEASLETKGLTFDWADDPEISIIIPVYNQLAYTLKCLRSLSQIDRTYSFEIVIMDDGSSDQTEELVGAIPNILYVRNQKNLGFLRNCNKGASLARGRYIVFLNNDTELDRNWLTALRRTYDNHANVGLVGSKLVYPTGQLQEAGGIIWEDGSAWNWGRMQDPAHPAYNYTRDVDYISGASIMIERDLFERLNRFDERYENAYYEDVDLAMAVRAAGLRVIYQPSSIVVHYEGISSGTDENAGIKRYQRLNGERFLDKWSDHLKGNLPNATTPYLACDRFPKRHVLVIDACTPTPDQDAGSVHMFNIIKILIKLGYRVHFIPQSNFAHFGTYSDALQALGVECVYAPFYYSVEDYVKERGDMFSHVMLTRYNVAAETIGSVKTYCPSAQRLFYTVDLHFLRESREAELLNDDTKRKTALETEKAEIGLMHQVNTTILLSDVEKKMLEERGVPNLAVLPLIQEQIAASDVAFNQRAGALFIGGYQHTPNIDAVDWLASEIWPRIREICSERGIPPIVLNVYGSKMPERFQDYAADDFKVHGFAENLSAIFDGVRLSVAPLRFGAGLKGKLATSFGHGVPVVGTDVAYEGVEDPDFASVNLTASDIEGIAKAIIITHEDSERWEKLRAASYRFGTKNYSFDAIGSRLKTVLGDT